MDKKFLQLTTWEPSNYSVETVDGPVAYNDWCNNLKKHIEITSGRQVIKKTKTTNWKSKKNLSLIALFCEPRDDMHPDSHQTYLSEEDIYKM